MTDTYATSPASGGDTGTPLPNVALVTLVNPSSWLDLCHVQSSLDLCHAPQCRLDRPLISASEESTPQCHVELPQPLSGTARMRAVSPAGPILPQGGSHDEK